MDNWKYERENMLNSGCVPCPRCGSLQTNCTISLSLDRESWKCRVCNFIYIAYKGVVEDVNIQDVKVNANLIIKTKEEKDCLNCKHGIITKKQKIFHSYPPKPQCVKCETTNDYINWEAIGVYQQMWESMKINLQWHSDGEESITDYFGNGIRWICRSLLSFMRDQEDRNKIG